MTSSMQTTGKLPVERRRYPGIRQIVDSPRFNILVLVCVVLSVVIILMETMGNWESGTIFAFDLLNEALTLFFVVELLMRWSVANTTRGFFSRHWVDIIAVLPMLRIFRLSRIFQLLRLVRIFSLTTILQRRLMIVGIAMEGRAVEYTILFIFMVFAMVFGTVGLAQFELGHSEMIKTPADAFWKSLFSLLEGQYGDYPATLGGKLVFVVLLLLGMTFFAMLVGTISAVMIEKLKESAMQKPLNPEELTGHVVICGFTSKVGILVREFTNMPGFSDCDIVLVSQEADLRILREEGVPTERIMIVKEDFTHMDALHKAAITRARAAVILSEAGNNRSTHDIDARTMLAALTIERINPAAHTCVEIYHAEYTDHLKMSGVDDVVIQGDISGRLLARAAMEEGVLPFFKDLLSIQEGHFLTFVHTPAELVGKDVPTALNFLHQTRRALLVGVRPNKQELLVNPDKHLFAADDELLIISPVPG